MASWSDAYQNISGATDPTALQGMQFDEPSLWDQYGNKSAGRYDPLSIEAFKKQKINELQAQQALPAQQRLAEFATTGKPLSEMGFSNLNAPQNVNESGGLPSGLTTQPFTPQEQNNPLVKKSIADFQAQQGTENTIAKLISGQGTPQDLARIAARPGESGQAMNALRQAKDAFLPSADTETPALRDFTTGVMSDFSEAPDLNSFIKKASGRLSQTKADPTKAASLVENLSKNFKTEKEPVSTEGNYRKGLEAQLQEQNPGWKPEKVQFEAARQVRKENALAQIQKIQTTIKLHDESKARNVQINGLTPQENDIIGQAIAERRLDPYRVNSRNQKVLAQTLLKNPNVDINSIAAEMTTARNKDVIMKSGVAEMIPGLLKETVNAGKSLNYSDAQFAGKVQKFMKGQLNDPKLVEYMTLRNDQLLTIGGVMRGNGMTDMAQRLEEEAAHPTMSPKALNGWLEGQLKSIDPRLSLYRKLTKGNTSIPRSEYQPRTGVAGLNATGKPSGPAVGTVKGGYRFKGGNPADKNSWVKVGG